MSITKLFCKNEEKQQQRHPQNFTKKLLSGITAINTLPSQFYFRVKKQGFF